MNRKSIRFVALALTFAGVATVGACGGDSPSAAPPAPPRAAPGGFPFTYKFFVEDHGQRKQMSVVPQEVANAFAHASQPGAAPASGTVTAQSAPGPVLPPYSSWIAPWYLVIGAASECGMIGDTSKIIQNDPILSTDPGLQEIVAMEKQGHRIPMESPQVPFADPTHYYIFPRLPASCDEVLEDEETVLCVADRIAQLADTIGPLRWHVQPASGTLSAANPPITWIMPPPAENEKFILRDVAFSVLGMIPMLDAYPLAVSGTTTPLRSCSALYAAYDAQPTKSPAYEQTLFGATPNATTVTYPPWTTSPRSIVAERQAFEANLLRGSGQLLHDLVRESVYSDLGGSAAQAAAAADPRGGQAIAYGLDGQTQYNSLAHAARTLLGRLEAEVLVSSEDPLSILSGILDPDPSCHGVSETDLFSELADPGMRARARDLGAVTASQATAEVLFEEAGLVLADGASVDLAAALTTELVGIKAAAAGLDPATFLSKPGGIALADLVATVSASDLARAAQHNRTTFSLLTSEGTNDAGALAGAATKAGLHVNGAVVNAAIQNAGIAIAGGLTRGDVAVDAMARIGPIAAASQCSAPGGLPALEMDEQALPVAILTADQTGASCPAGPCVRPYPGTFAHQDVFALGQSIRARMVKLREQADHSASTDAGASRDAQARAGAVAEIGAWAGSGRVVLSTEAGDATVTSANWPQHVFVDLLGVTPADFGVAQVADLPDVIRLVSGDPKLAECAAGITANACDPAALAAASLAPASVSFASFGAGSPDPATPAGQSTLRARYGLTGGTVRLTFPSPSPAVAASFLSAPIHVVATPHPVKHPGGGQILATLQLPTSYVRGRGGAGLSGYFGETSTTLSPMRRELVGDAFGLGKWVGAAPPQAGELSIAGTPSFCIEGVRRDLFVPLQNDLTGDQSTYENSWRIYLTQAQSAAQRADDIGQTLVDLGFQKDTSIENAATQLQSVSGSPTNVDDLSIDENGKVHAGSSNAALGALLEQPTLDVVFFASDPLGIIPPGVTGGACTSTFGPRTDAALLTRLTAALGCAANPGNSMCQKVASAHGVQAVSAGCAATFTGASDPLLVTYTALNLTTAAPQGGPSVCNEFVRSAAALKGVTLSTPAGAPAGSLGPPVYSSGLRFDNAPIVSGLQKWGSDSGGVQATLQRAHMTVRDDASWTITYGGALLMESRPQEAWPGCLDPKTPKAPGSTTGCDWANPVIDSFNDTLRACRPGTDLRAPLGQCDGGDPLFEVNSLRWRLQGVLWLAAMMSGNVPFGLITTPTPAANGATGGVPIPMYYINGAFTFADGTPDSSAHFLGGLGSDNDVLDGSGGARRVPADSPWYKWSPAGAALLPPWLRAAYQPASPYGNPLVHVMGSTVSGAADFTTPLNLFFTNHITASGVKSTIGRFEWPPLTERLNGRQCATPGAEPLGPALDQADVGGAHWLQGLVTSIKTSHAASSMMGGVFEGADAPDGKAAVQERQFWWCENSGSFCESVATTGDAFDETLFFAHTPLYWLQFHDGNGGLGSVETTDTWPVDWATKAPKEADMWRSISQGFGTRDRARFAINAGAPSSDCDAAQQFTQAIALSCILDQGIQESFAPIAEAPPPLDSLDGLTAVSAWLRSNVRHAAATLQNAYVQRVPTNVVANAIGAPGSLASAGGTAGTGVVQAANAMLDVYAQWNLVVKDADAIASAVEETRNAIAIAATEADIATVNTSIERLHTIKALANDVAQIARGVQSEMDLAYAGGEDITAGIVGLVTDGLTMPLLDQLDKDQHQLDAEKIQQALYSLHDTVVSDSTAMTNALIAVRQDTNNITAGTQQFATARAEASYYAGKAVGANVWQCAGADGATVECSSHVNTVLNRRYDGQEIRYQNALREAKALGYVARRAIEQRIGVRLTDITTNVGPLEPPSTWADDVCHLTGINYKRLRSEISLDAGEPAIGALDAQIAGDFADAFIGDYTQKLADFVQYYDLAYPEADGNDEAILSLRESLLGGKSSCMGPSPNLLSDPVRLQGRRGSTGSSVLGWTTSACPAGAATCLHVEMGSGAGPTFAGPGGISWLSDRAPTQSPTDDGADAGASAGPPGAVSQAVALHAAGTYLLSWWDQARDPQSGRPATDAAPYRVAVYDSTWAPIAAFSDRPAASDSTGTTWSARRVVSFRVSGPDVVHVAFSASTSGGGAGSVAIADPQLELAGVSGTPTPFVNRGPNDPLLDYTCPLSSSELREAFVHRCDADGACYYDLQRPFTIDTRSMTSNGLPLDGKLASGNYNFRHVDLALNVAGTGVIDCSQLGSPDCQGSGYLTFTLSDDASNVGVLGFDGQYRPFDFGTGAIEHGKALTAERYLTTPLSAADEQLVAQVRRTELRGRPLDGTYRLRIYDTPALRFEQIDDVQLVVRYHYWSRVSAPQNAN